MNPSHVDQVLAAATATSGMDGELGGGGVVRDVAARAMQWSAGLLHAQFPEHMRTDLFAAVSRLGIVVGASARMVTYAAQHAAGNAEWRSQAQHRIGCLRGRSGLRPWSWTGIL